MQELLTNKTIDRLKYDLVRDGLISYEDLSKAEEISLDTNTNLAQVLIKSGLISEDRLLGFIEAKLHIPYVNLDDYVLDENCLHLISPSDAKNNRIIPLFKIEDVLTVAMADPLDLFVLKNLTGCISYKIEPIICSERSILYTIKKYYFSDNVEQSNIISDTESRFDWRDELNNENHDDFQAQRIIQAILHQAVIENFQEIFFEYTFNGLAVRFKNDNQIVDRGNIPVLLVSLCLLNLKALSNLDASITDLPQLGKIRFIVNNQNISASIATFPTTKGERTSIKIYSPPKDLDVIFTDREKLSQISANINKPGLILVCGPENVNKSSLIYSILSSIKDKNIITVESITKYDLAGINQCELNENVGFNLERVAKFISFQSPDVIYLEEMFNTAGIELISSLVMSDKLVITEFIADSLESMHKKLNCFNHETVSKTISCIIFTDNSQLEVLAGEYLNLILKK